MTTTNGGNGRGRTTKGEERTEATGAGKGVEARAVKWRQPTLKEDHGDEGERGTTRDIVNTPL